MSAKPWVESIAWFIGTLINLFKRKKKPDGAVVVKK